MGLMSSKIEREKLRPGDHIYTWRNGYSYSHHGIYVGDGKVIHLTRGPGLIIFSRSRPSNDRVECCSIEDFLCDGQLYCFEYGVDPVELVTKRAGTCSAASSNPPEDVLHRAACLLEHGFGNYDLLNKNCEDFSIYCKTGLLRIHNNRGGISGQIGFLFASLFAIVTFPYRFMPANLIVSALLFLWFYCSIRFCADVGAESTGCDVVPVEKLDHLISNTHNVREKMKILEIKSTPRWLLPHGRYVSYGLLALRYWYWTPEKTLEDRSKYRYYCMSTRTLALDSGEFNSSVD
ncbi:hypothetical protein FNV43_RR24395 [Rhamnella rubrinervis]|uniref:LRAT domain-containing protein n=1 Tax=Rhamnella rubrinervis TaxID=2594499 RepID=A0A8K0DSC2_9ROSA|nr:hypothetical protein FNV43_RR24395 [Rhamnella rubrinervis]